MLLDEFKIIGDFVLAKDVTLETERGKGGLFFVSPEDDRMSSDNLHLFEVVKLPEHGIDEERYVPVEIGDRIISISTGSDLRIDDRDYKLFELKYITAKINGHNDSQFR